MTSTHERPSTKIGTPRFNKIAHPTRRLAIDEVGNPARIFAFAGANPPASSPLLEGAIVWHRHHLTRFVNEQTNGGAEPFRGIGHPRCLNTTARRRWGIGDRISQWCGAKPPGTLPPKPPIPPKLVGDPHGPLDSCPPLQDEPTELNLCEGNGNGDTLTPGIPTLGR